MNIGNFKERITLYKRHIIEKENGDFDEKWHSVLTLWAKLTPIKTNNETSLQEGWNQIKHLKSLSRYSVLTRDVPHLFQRVRWKNKWFSLLTPIYTNGKYLEFSIGERLAS